MKTSFILLLCFTIIGCKTNRIVNGEREGLWIEQNKIGDKTYKSRGRYRAGFERKTWKYFENGQLVKKEVYKDSVCRVTHFKNKKKSLEGQTKMRYEGKDLHWFYTGDWIEYDSLGKPVVQRIYHNGVLIGEKSLSGTP